RLPVAPCRAHVGHNAGAAFLFGVLTVGADAALFADERHKPERAEDDARADEQVLKRVRLEAEETNAVQVSRQRRRADVRQTHEMLAARQHHAKYDAADREPK